MTNEEILRLAEQCGFYLIDFVDEDGEVTEQIEAQTSESLYIFAAMLLVIESDECAKLCEEAALLPDAGPIYCANAIRSRNA